MFWDASLDQNNIINGKTYSENIAEFMDGKTGLPSKTPVTTQTQPTKEATKTEEPHYEVKNESKLKEPPPQAQTVPLQNETASKPTEETTKTEPQYEVKDESKLKKTPSHPIHPSKTLLLHYSSSFYLKNLVILYVTGSIY